MTYHPMGDQPGVPAVANPPGEVKGGFVSNLAEGDGVEASIIAIDALGAPHTPPNGGPRPRSLKTTHGP
jgi:hypothetical protein